MIINANDIKTKGVSIFGTLLEKFDELIINVRGKNQYIVLDTLNLNLVIMNEEMVKKVMVISKELAIIFHSITIV